MPAAGKRTQKSLAKQPGWHYTFRDYPKHLRHINLDLRTGTIETRHLKIFVAVYKNRSFTKASEQLHTSQPTVSEHIHNLETRLDCKLFDRLGRSIMPTLEAQILYPRALAILEDLRKLEDEMAATGKGVAGPLIIGASTIPGDYPSPGWPPHSRPDIPGFPLKSGSAIPPRSSTASPAMTC